MHKRKLFVEIYNKKKSFEAWKRVLDVCQEGVIIYKNKEVFYYNEGLEALKKKYSIISFNVIYQYKYRSMNYLKALK